MYVPVGIWALILAAAFIAAGGAVYAQGGSAPADCRETGPLPEQIGCFLQAAETQGDVSICESAYDFAVRFNCISLFAEHRGDAAPCARIPIRNNRLLVMRDSCVSGVAAATRTPQLCEQIKLAFLRDACFLVQVVDLDAPPALCERITRHDVRETCLAP